MWNDFRKTWNENLYIQIGLLSFLIFVLYATFLIFNSVDLSKSGLFGDSFGFINSLFSVFAFVAVLISLKSQQAQIEKQQQEYFESKRDSEKHVEEERFFKLLDLYRDNLSGLKDTKKGEGLDVIINMLKKSRSVYEKSRYPIKPIIDLAIQYEAYALKESFLKYTKVHQRYFSAVNVIVDVITRNENNNRIYYCKLFSSSLTWYEKDYILVCYLLRMPGMFAEVCDILGGGLPGQFGVRKRWRGSLKFFIKNKKPCSVSPDFKNRVDLIHRILELGEVSSVSSIKSLLIEIEQSSECPDRMFKVIKKIIGFQIKALNRGDDLEFSKLSSVMHFVRLNLKNNS